MRILHVITSLKKAAGTSVFCSEVCNGLVAAGHEVTTADVDPEAQDCCPIDQRVKRISISSLLHDSARSTWQTNSKLLTSNFELIHIHALWSPILHRTFVWARKNKIPIVLSPHGMLAPWAMRHKWWKKCVPWHLYQRRDLLRVDMFHATSKQEGTWIRELGFTQPITVVPLGTKLPDLRPLAAKQDKVLLFVGRIYPVKALDRLIQAFAEVSFEVRREWRLRLVGPDQAGHRKSLELLVKSLGLGNCVEFAGPKFDEELNAEYDACDCLALVSHTENLGATVVDAMAHGKPVITSVNTPWREVSERGCGWWVSNEPRELAEALAEMMALTDDERRHMGACARKLVEEKYTWDSAVREMEKGYMAMTKQMGL